MICICSIYFATDQCEMVILIKHIELNHLIITDGLENITIKEEKDKGYYIQLLTRIDQNI